jgi:hypothetical protein
LADLEKNVKNLFKIDDINSKESPSYQSHPTKEFGKDKIPNHITELLYNIRQSPIEFGGGYSPELFYNDYKLPETIVLRKLSRLQLFMIEKQIYQYILILKDS